MRGSTLATALLLLAPLARADVLCLRDGRVFDGVDLERGDEGVTIHFENGDVFVPAEQVLDCIQEGESEFVPRTDEEREKAERGLVPFRGEWMKPRRRERMLEDYLEEKREEVEEMRRTRLWRNRVQEGTKYFDFEYTVPAHVFEPLKGKMEAYLELFIKRWKIKKPRDCGPLVVKAYVDPDAFYQVTGVPRGVLAFFRPQEPPFELDFYYDRLDSRGTERFMFHEFGHYVQKLVEVDFFYPHFPGEAVAEYFSTATYDPDKGDVTLDRAVLEDRVAEIQLDIKEGHYLGLEALVRGGTQRNYHDYTWGWSLVHFLMSDPHTADDFEDFFLALARDRQVDRVSASVGMSIRYKGVDGDTIWEVFRDEMGLKSDEDVRELERAWHEYVDRELDVSSGRGLAGAARRAMYRGRLQRAKRLFEDAVEVGGVISVQHDYYAQLLSHLDDEEGAREEWRRAIELDPLVAAFYVELGTSLVMRGEPSDEQKAEGKRLLKLAKEIEPENYFLERNLEMLLKR